MQECSWFCFARLLQDELDELVHKWNTHYIKKSNHNVISGIPEELFYLPQTVGFDHCGRVVHAVELEGLLQNYDLTENMRHINRCDQYLESYFLYIIRREGLMYPPSDWWAAERMFDAIIRHSGTLV